MASHLSERLKKDRIKANFVLTIDAAYDLGSGKLDRTIDGNVEENLNINQTKGWCWFSWRKDKRDDGSETVMQNEISVGYIDKNGKNQTAVLSNVDESPLQSVI